MLPVGGGAPFGSHTRNAVLPKREQEMPLLEISSWPGPVQLPTQKQKRMSTASSLKNKFEQQIQEVNAVPEKPKKPQKQREWTPTNNGATGAHNATGYSAQTKKQTRYAEGQLPPKKSLTDLP